MTSVDSGTEVEGSMKRRVDGPWDGGSPPTGEGRSPLARNDGGPTNSKVFVPRQVPVVQDVRTVDVDGVIQSLV